MSDIPMGEGWWLASDGKWYAPELHPTRRHDSHTEELRDADSSASVTPPPLPPRPQTQHHSPASSEPPPSPPPAPVHQAWLYRQATAGHWQHDPTTAVPASVAETGPTGQPPGRDVKNLVVIGLIVLVVMIAGSLVAFALIGGDGVADQSITGTTGSATASSSTLSATTSRPFRSTTTTSEFDPEPSSTLPSTTTSRPTRTTLVPPPPTTDPERSVMPDVLCMELPAAKRAVRDVGSYFPRSFDASGEGRMQIIDSNWIVVSQDPRPGRMIGQTDVRLGVLKKDEPNLCSEEG